MECMNCGYPMADLPHEHPCPECGCVQRRSCDDFLQAKAKHLWMLICWSPLAAVVTTFGFIAFGSGTFILFPLTALGLIVLAVRYEQACRRVDPERARAFWMLTITTALSAGVFVYFVITLVLTVLLMGWAASHIKG